MLQGKQNFLFPPSSSHPPNTPPLTLSTDSHGSGGHGGPPEHIVAASPDPNFPPGNRQQLHEGLIFDEPSDKKQPVIEGIIFDEPLDKKQPVIEGIIFDEPSDKKQPVIEGIVFDESPYEEQPPQDESEPPTASTQSSPGLEVSCIYEKANLSPVSSPTDGLYQPPTQPPQLGLMMPGANVLVNPVVQQAPVVLMSAPTGEDIQKATGELADKPTAYELAHKLIKLKNIKVDGENIYCYNGRYYERLSERALRRLITAEFRSVMEAGASAQFRREIRESILDEPTLGQDVLTPDQEAVSFLNGVVTLVRGELVPHNPRWITTYCLQCNFLPGFGVPEPSIFFHFLADITGGDNVLCERILQMLGYILTPDTTGKVFFLLQGVPNSGKSVLSLLIRSFFSEDARITLDVHDFSERFAVSSLFGKALCLSPDLPTAILDSRAVSKIKQFTGGDNVTADQKFKERISFICTAKLVLATNHPLIIRGEDQAFVNRAVVIPFKYATPPELQDRTLLARLIAEKDAIATYALYAYSRLVANHYVFAGDYRVNEVVSSSTPSNDLTMQICNFALTNFEKCQGSLVLVADARKRFEEEHIPVSSQQFTPLFTQITSELFGAKPVKTHNGYKNSRKHISGIKWKASEPKE